MVCCVKTVRSIRSRLKASKSGVSWLLLSLDDLLVNESGAITSSTITAPVPLSFGLLVLVLRSPCPMLAECTCTYNNYSVLCWLTAACTFATFTADSQSVFPDRSLATPVLWFPIFPFCNLCGSLLVKKVLHIFGSYWCACLCALVQCALGLFLGELDYLHSRYLDRRNFCHFFFAGFLRFIDSAHPSSSVRYFFCS